MGRAWRGLWIGTAALLCLVVGAEGRAAEERFDTVVIDAGHGGDDTGARGGRGLREKDLVLDVARRLALRLRDQGLRVVMTRDDDTFVPLEQRTWLANDARADLFVSIHANAAADREVSGTETYFLSLQASDESARRVAERENAAFGDAAALLANEDPFVALMGDLISADDAAESDAFAKMVQGQLAETGSRSRGVKQAPFVVLANVQMPSVLVEIGFLTNPSDERQLARADGRDRIVRALSEAVQDFRQRYEAKRRPEQDAVPPAAGE
jgi:N-acetylmuramoyl-L-alanine amidase